MGIILATASPYRRETFMFLGLEFEAEESHIDEGFEPRPQNPKELVAVLAQMKADAVAGNHKEGVVIGFDSVGFFKGKILEKPGSRQEAFQRLESLSGNNHSFYTGIHMINLSNKRVLSRVVKSDVAMREFSREEINRYLDQDPGFSTYALGYDPFGHYSSTFIRRLEGSYNNVLRGIPLEVIVEMLSEIGFDITEQ